MFKDPKVKKRGESSSSNFSLSSWYFFQLREARAMKIKSNRQYAIARLNLSSEK
jgi:hypothetical protein